MSGWVWETMKEWTLILLFLVDVFLLLYRVVFVLSSTVFSPHVLDYLVVHVDSKYPPSFHQYKSSSPTINSSVGISVFVLFNRLTISFCFFSTTACLTYWKIRSMISIESSSYMFIHMKSNLTNIHIIRLSKISHRCIDNIHFIQFTSFDTVCFY